MSTSELVKLREDQQAIQHHARGGTHQPNLLLEAQTVTNLLLIEIILHFNRGVTLERTYVRYLWWHNHVRWRR